MTPRPRIDSYLQIGELTVLLVVATLLLAASDGDGRLEVVVTAGRLLVAIVASGLAWSLIASAIRARKGGHLPDHLEAESDLHRKKEVFLAAASHHINTPLTGVVGLAELLQDRTRDLNTGVRNEIIELLAIQARETAHVVDDILVAARTDLGELMVFEDKVDLRRITEQSISGMGSALRSRITIQGHAIARADRRWVEHIIRNLIRNASSYGGENIGVRIHTANGNVLVEIIDDGEGLPNGAEDVVFSTHYTSQQLSGLAPSLGLGLLVARSLARAMGGDLAYQRDAGQSVFELTLPLGLREEQIDLSFPEVTVDPRASHPNRAAIEKVLAAGGPGIVFEPVIDLRARHRGEERVFGYEALSRFDFASPPEWFDAAQTAGLQVELDLTCIHAAVSAFASSHLKGWLAINVHDSTLMSSLLLDALEGLDPFRTVIELSETASIRNYEKTIEVVDSLRERGIRLAIDDVGSGELDLWHILRLQPAIIKIDRSLVCDIDSTPRNRALIRGLVAMATDLGILVVCEGVEREVEEDFLLDLGVQLGQGYLFDESPTLGRPDVFSQGF